MPDITIIIHVTTTTTIIVLTQVTTTMIIILTQVNMITTSLIFRLPAILLFCLSYWTSLRLKIGEEGTD